MSKKILLIANRLDFGGAEVYVVSIANRLVKLGYEVHVASSGGKLVDNLVKEIKHYTVPADAKKAPGILSCALKINKIIKKNSINIIHSNSVITCLIARLATLFTRTKIVNTAHSWGTEKKPVSAKIVNTCANKVIAVSYSTAESYIMNGLKREKVIVIHNGIDTDKFQKQSTEAKLETRKALELKPDDFVVINIARMEERRKRHDVLIDAAHKIVKEHNNCKFLLVGDGNLRKSFENKVQELQLTTNIFFLGNRDDIVNLLNASDIFCLPSDWEGLPLVIAEAMACGLPVVATEVNGVPEIVENIKTGYLVTPRDPNSIAVNIINLIENNESLVKMSLNCIQKVQDSFSLNHLIEKLDNLYKQM